MNRWLFRLTVLSRHKNGVTYRFRVGYMKREGKRFEFTGSAQDALNTRLRLGKGVHRLDIVSVGLVEPEASDRRLCEIQEQRDGWHTTESRGFHGLRSKELEDAVNYNLQRVNGYVAEIRILNRAGNLKHIVLCDQSDRIFAKTWG